MMSLLLRKSWTVELATEHGDEVARSRPNGASCNLGFGVSDNKAYFVKTAHVHAQGVEGADESQRANGEYLYTVNNLEVPVIFDGENDIDLKRGWGLITVNNQFFTLNSQIIYVFIRCLEQGVRVFLSWRC